MFSGLSPELYQHKYKLQKTVQQLACYWTAWSRIPDEKSYVKNHIREELCMPIIAKLAEEIARCFPDKSPAIASRIMTHLFNEMKNSSHSASEQYLFSRCAVIVKAETYTFPIVTFQKFLPPENTNDLLIEIENLQLALTNLNNENYDSILSLFTDTVLKKITARFTTNYSDQNYAQTQLMKGLNNLLVPRSEIYKKSIIEKVCRFPHISEELSFVLSELNRYTILKEFKVITLIEYAIPLANFFKTIYFQKGESQFLQKLITNFIDQIGSPEKELLNTPITPSEINYPSVTLTVSAKNILCVVLKLFEITQEITNQACKEYIAKLMSALSDVSSANPQTEKISVESSKALQIFKVMHDTCRVFQNYNNEVEKEVTKALKNLESALLDGEKWQALQILKKCDAIDLDLAMQAILHCNQKEAVKLALVFTHLELDLWRSREIIFLLYQLAPKQQQFELIDTSLLLQKMQYWGRYNTFENRKFVCDNHKKISPQGFLEIRINSQSSPKILDYIPEIIYHYFNSINSKTAVRPVYKNSKFSLRNNLFTPELNKLALTDNINSIGKKIR